MKLLSANKFIIAALMLCISACIFVFIISLQQTKKVKQTSVEVVHTNKVLSSLDKIMTATLEIQNGTRGFVITGDEYFTEPVITAGQTFDNALAVMYNLENHTHVIKSNLDSLRILFSKRIELAQQTIALRKQQKTAQAAANIASGAGEKLTRQIRKICDSVKRTELNVQDEIRTKNDKAILGLNTVLYTALVIILLLGILLFIKVITAFNEHRVGEGKFKALLESAPDAMLISDNNGRIQLANREAEKMLAYTREELTGMSFETLIPPHQREKHSHLRINYSQAPSVRNMESGGSEMQAMKKDGTIIPVEISLSPIHTNGEVLVASAIRDISQRKAAQQEIETLFTQINQANEAIYVVNNDLLISSWNKGAENLYGYSKEEALGKNSIALLRTELTDEQMQAVAAAIKENKFWSGEVKRKRKSNEEIYVHTSLSSVKNNETGSQSFVSVSFDRTPLKKLEEQVKHLASIVEQSSEAIISSDIDKKIVSWNKGAEIMLGYKKTEVTGKDILKLDICKLTEQEITELLDSIAKNGSASFEKEYFHKNGRVITGAVSANIMKDENGNITGIVFIIKDITLRKQLENQLKKHNDELEEKVKQRTEDISRSEEKYRLLFENNPMPMWVYEIATYKILSVNKAAEILYGYSREEFLSMTLLDVRSEEEKVRFLKVDHSFDRKEKSLRRGIWKHLKKDRTEIQIEIFNHALLFEGKLARLTMLNNVTERMKAETSLVTSEKRFRALIENNYDIITMLDKDFNVIYRSPSTQRITGYTDDEMIGFNGLKNVHPDDIPAAKAGIASLLSVPGSVAERQFRIKHKNGSYLWMEGNATNLLHDENIKAIVLNYRDVTERVLAESKLKASEKRFRALIENNYDIITMLDSNFNVLYRSPSAVRVSGRTDEEVLGLDGTKRIHPEDMPAVTAGIKRLLAAPGNVEECIFRYQHKDGSYLWMEGNATNLLHDESVNAIVFNYREVTERIMAQENLTASEKRFRALTENSYDIITLLDKNFKISYRSPSATRVTEYTNEEIIGSDCRIKIHPGDVEGFSAIAANLLAAPGNITQFMFRYQHKNGHYLWMEGNATNLLEDANVNAIVFNYRDVSERIAAQEKTAASERRFRSLIENGSDIINLLDESFNIIYRSPSSAHTGCLSDEDVFGSDGRKRIHPGDIQTVAEGIQRLLAAPGNIEKTIFRYQHSNGRYMWLEGTATNLLHDEAVKAIVFNYREVSERIEAEEKLKASEVRYRTTLDNMIEGVQIIGFDWKYKYVNNAVVKQAKQKKENLLAHSMTELYPGIEQTSLFKTIQQCLDKRTPVQLENKFEYGDGTVAWFELSIQPVPEGVFILSVDITEKVMAAAALKEEKDKLANIAATSPGLIYAFRMKPDGSFSFPFVSSAVEDIFGFTDESIKNNVNPIIESALQDDISIVINSIKESAEKMAPWQLEFRYNHPVKGIVWLEGNSLPLREADGSTIWHGIIMDITERKKITGKIAEKNAQLETLSNNLPGVLIFQLNGDSFENRQFSYISKEVTRLTGKTPEEVLADPTLLYRLLEPDDIGKFTAAEKKSYESMSTFNEEVRCRNYKGDMRWLNIVSTPRKTHEGKIVWDGFHVDITERKKNEAALHNSYVEKRLLAERLSTILNTLPANIALLDNKGMVVDINKSWLQFSGESGWQGSNYNIGDDYAKVSLSAFGNDFASGQKIAAGVKSVLNGYADNFVYEYSCSQLKEKRWFRLIVSPLRGTTYTGAVVMHIDISEIHLLEEERMRSKTEEQRIITKAIIQGQEKERNAIGKELHDNINQILAGVNMLLGLISKRPERLGELLPLCIDHMSMAMTENRKIAHKLVSPGEDTAELIDLIQRTTDSMLQKAGIDVKIDYSNFNEHLLSKEQKLAVYRIIQEQCTNIAKYSAAQKVLILLHSGSSRFLVVIKDDGIGMDTTKKSDGIGLQNIRSRVNILNGIVTVTSKPGAGFMLSADIPIKSSRKLVN